MLKQERHRRILDVLDEQGRVVAAELQHALGVSGHTVRRDLDELAATGRLQRVHGGALARSTVATTYEGRQRQEVQGKAETARAATALFERGTVAIFDGGTTALELARALPHDHEGTAVTHSPPVAAALASRPGLEVVLVGGTVDHRAMVALGARAIDGFRAVHADVCFLGVWAVHAEAGLTTGYFEEAELRRVLVARADRVVGLVTRDKLGTIAPFRFAPATALTDLATERAVPEELLAPFRELGIDVVQ